MIDYLDVIVLQDARAVRDNLAEELAKRDFSVRSCGSLAGLRHLYATQPAPLLVLTGDSDDLACDAQSARLAAPSAIIIALGTSADTAWRTHVMAAGADACHSASIDIAELMAILLAWGRQAVRGFSVELPVHARAHGASVDHGRRPPSALPDAAAALADDAGDHDRDGHDDGGDRVHRHHRHDSDRDNDRDRDASDQAIDVLRRAASQSATSSLSIVQPPTLRIPPISRPPRAARLGSGWRLDANCRVLACPHDRTLFVTAAENSFLMRIAACEGQLLRRHRHPAPATPATPAVEGDDSGTQPIDIRSMDVLVSRLRRKARRAGIELPLLAVRGCGYLFSECLTVTPSALAPRAAGGLKLHRATKRDTTAPIPRPPYKLEDSGRMYRPYGRDADLRCDLSVHEVVYQLLAA